MPVAWGAVLGVGVGDGEAPPGNVGTVTGTDTRVVPGMDIGVVVGTVTVGTVTVGGDTGTDTGGNGTAPADAAPLAPTTTIAHATANTIAPTLRPAVT
jgi:hypothetical protein